MCCPCNLVLSLQPPYCSPKDAIALRSLHKVRAAAFVRGEDEGANHNDASWLLDFYQTFADDIDADCTDHALSALSQIEGRFGAAALVAACSSWGLGFFISHTLDML